MPPLLELDNLEGLNATDMDARIAEAEERAERTAMNERGAADPEETV